jgi:tetratricopeptide (TPR) repeat protein
MPAARIRALSAAAFALSAMATLAAEPKHITAGELALTPPFCQDVQTINGWSQHGRESPRSPYWISKMGKTFWGMHHYCWALVNIQRSSAPGQSPEDRAFKIHSAIADYYYIVEIAPPDFVLLPEVFYLIGEAHVMVNEYAQATEAYQKARRIKADYWPPYEGQAKVLDKVGLKAEALAVLEDGLRIMPGEVRLLSLYARLGGSPVKLPPPMPMASAPVSAAAPASGALGGVSASASQPR